MKTTAPYKNFPSTIPICKPQPKGLSSNALQQMIGFRNKKGAILPTYENVVNGTYQPLARPLFIYASKKSADKPEVKRFIDFYMKNSGSLSKEVGYIALPEKAHV